MRGLSPRLQCVKPGFKKMANGESVLNAFTAYLSLAHVSGLICVHSASSSFALVPIFNISLLMVGWNLSGNL